MSEKSKYFWTCIILCHRADVRFSEMSPPCGQSMTAQPIDVLWLWSIQAADLSGLT